MKPQNVNQVEDRTVRIALFELDKINALPGLLKHYVALIETAQKMGGEVSTTYGSTVEVLIPKDRKQLQERLEYEQREWDRYSDLYAKVRSGEAIKSYYESGVTEWAKNEGLDAPEFVKEDEDAEV
jgi:uncharacterized protein YdeI (YjbR/CyaY-like superfamily)